MGGKAKIKSGLDVRETVLEWNTVCKIKGIIVRKRYQHSCKIKSNLLGVHSSEEDLKFITDQRLNRDQQCHTCF